MELGISLSDILRSCDGDIFSSRARPWKPDWIMSMSFGAVVVGRNEGERLKRCLQALTSADLVVYVDSGSTDGSPDWARSHGAEVVELDMSRPFTAARARNAGFVRLRERLPDVRYVQFVDGDCEIVAGWPDRAVEFLGINGAVAAVCGRRRERWPDRSIYNWLCDQEWAGPTGEVQAFGGDVMMRADALVQVKGYCDALIAGEDPELGVRLRAAGWRLWRLEGDMTLHDAAMTRFGQWWLRIVRSGYAFAEGAQMHGRSPARHWVWESRRAWLWGVWLPLVCAVVSVVFGSWGWLIWMIYPVQVLRQTLRNHGPLRERAAMASFQVLARFAEALGQLKYFRDRAFGFQARLIEYK